MYFEIREKDEYIKLIFFCVLKLIQSISVAIFSILVKFSCGVKKQAIYFRYGEGGRHMKISIKESEVIEELEIVINCNKIDEELLKIIAAIKAFDMKITGTSEGHLYPLEMDNIYYFESVDKKTFIYLHNKVYETALRLYELEKKLENTDFFRASKSTIINLSKIKMITPVFGGRLEVLLENDEKLVVSRQYVGSLKRKLDF